MSSSCGQVPGKKAQAHCFHCSLSLLISREKGRGLGEEQACEKVARRVAVGEAKEREPGSGEMPQDTAGRNGLNAEAAACPGETPGEGQQNNTKHSREAAHGTEAGRSGPCATEEPR